MRRLVEKSAALLDLEIRGDLDDVFSLAPRRAGALDALLPALERHPPAAREGLCVRRPSTDDPGIWLHPGEPVFDALAAQIRRTFARDALRGAIFADPKADEPYCFHLALASVEQEADNGAPAAGAASAAVNETGAREVLERRLLAVRQGPDGAPNEYPVEHLLLLRGAPGVAPGAVPLASRGIGLRAAAAAYAVDDVAARMAETHRGGLQAELPARRRRIGVGFDLRAAELAGRRTKLSNAASSPDAATALDAVKQEPRALAAERRLALHRLETAPERVMPGGVRFLAHALVVPAPSSEALERYDARVEEMAVRMAAAWEKERGASVRDVSRPELARQAGLPDWPGFDLLATLPDGNVRSIEVKGRAGRTSIEMEANEWKQACHLGERYWLYVVLDCATPRPTLVRVRDPFARLLARNRSSSTYVISATSLLEAAEQA